MALSNALDATIVKTAQAIAAALPPSTIFLV